MTERDETGIESSGLVGLLGDMKRLSDISRRFNTEQRKGESEGDAYKEVRNEAYNHYTGAGSRIVNPDIGGAENAEALERNDAITGFQITSQKAQEDASRTIRENPEREIGAVVGDLEDKKLGGLLLSKNVDGNISDESRKGYEDFSDRYQNYVGAIELKKKADEGTLSEREKIQVSQGVAEKVYEDTIQKFRGEGYSVELQQVAAKAERDAVLKGRVNDDELKEGASKLVKDLKEKLGEDYQTKARGYVVEGLRNYQAKGMEELDNTRDVLYSTRFGED
jgi:hypothetical protein